MEGNKPIISVIVPMFNTEEFIQETIDSLLGQTLQDIEIILIDDYSTDATYELVLPYTFHYSHIVLLRQKENRGVSAARNAGLAVARGEFIFFLDSDDTIPSYSLEMMYKAAVKHRADIVTGVYERFDKSSKSISNIFNIYPELKNEGNISLYEVPGLLYSVYSCGKLFKRDMLLEASFLETVNYGEDQIFTIEAFFKSNRIYNLSSIIYNYRVRDGETESLSQSIYKDPVQNFKYLQEMLKVIEKLFVQYVSNPQIRLELYSVYLSRVLHWNIWTALSHGLLSMNMSTRLRIITNYLSWFENLNGALYETNRLDFSVINHKVNRIRNVVDRRTQELCDRLQLKFQ